MSVIPPKAAATVAGRAAKGHKRSFACIAINCGSEYPRLHYGPYNGARKRRGGRWACTLYDVRPHAWASIFHSSPRRKRICEGTGPSGGLALNGDRERPRYDGIRVGALHVPEPHLIGHVLVRDSKVLTPLFYVSKPIGRSIRVQPPIRCDAINDDGGVPKDAVEKLDILGVETVDVIIDKGLDFSRRFLPRFLRASRKWQSRHNSNDRDKFASPHRFPPCEMIS